MCYFLTLVNHQEYLLITHLAWLLDCGGISQQRNRVLPSWWSQVSCKMLIKSYQPVAVLTNPKQRGLSWLKAAGIQAILDHHALPGVQTAGQQFTGR
jgi:inorganic pyrophosphatase/exopolyphosphatase